jgi:hypothetical protein
MAGMQVKDCGAGFGRGDRLFKDLLRAQGQIFRHAGSMHGARYGAGDDDFLVCLVHGLSLGLFL